ncbi:MAG: hypothetical protein ACP5QK_05060 [Myxococcota bacterium]
MPDKRRGLMLSGISYSLLLLILYFVKFRENIFLLYISGILLLLALILPKFYKPINFLINPVGRFLINLIVNILLILLFYLVFSPVALIRRLLVKDGVIKKDIDIGCTTYFVDKPKVEYDRRFFERLY